MEFIYSHPDKGKAQKLYRRLCIIRNKIAELNERNNYGFIEQFTLHNEIKMYLATIERKRLFEPEIQTIVLVVKDGKDNTLFGLSIEKDSKYCAVIAHLLHEKEPEMLAIYIEQLEVQVDEALDKLNKVNRNNYSRKLAESLFG